MKTAVPLSICFWAVVLATLAHAAPPPAIIAPTTFGAPAFLDTFYTLDAGPDATAKASPLHRWRTVTGSGGPTVAGYRSLNAMTYFGDATTAINPFKTPGSYLAITATKAVCGLLSRIQKNHCALSYANQLAADQAAVQTESGEISG